MEIILTVSTLNCKFGACENSMNDFKGDITIKT